jgi:hypothetical protein
MRDLQKDLEYVNNYMQGAHFQSFYEYQKRANKFRIESREGWPEAITRAIAAEARVKELEDGIRKHKSKSSDYKYNQLEVDKELYKLLEGK